MLVTVILLSTLLLMLIILALSIKYYKAEHAPVCSGGVIRGDEACSLCGAEKDEKCRSDDQKKE